MNVSVALFVGRRLLRYSLIFVLSLGTLWGWNVIGLAAFAVLAMITMTNRELSLRVLREEDSLTKPERLIVLYFVALFGISLVVNTFFVLASLFSTYRSPFGHIPL